MRNRARLCLSALNDALKDNNYIAGNTFSAADIMLGYTIMLGVKLLPEPMPTNVTAYWDRLQQRPAYQRAFGDTG
jgi:glutathione S-transferase